MPTYNPVTGFFSDSSLLPVWPHDPDAPRLLATGRYALIDAAQPAVSSILAQLAHQGNPTSPEGVVAQAQVAGVSLFDATPAAASLASGGVPAMSGISNIQFLSDPAAPSTAVNVGPGSGFDASSASSIAAGVQQLRGIAMQIYGSADLGVVRNSSAALENNPTGIRPGYMERLVLPAYASYDRRPF